MNANLVRCLARHASGASQFIDYLVQNLIVDNNLDALSNTLSALKNLTPSINREEAKSCLFHLASRLAEQILGSATREEKTRTHYELLGLQQHKLESVTIRGIVSGVDFSSCVCRHCVFRDVTFTRCLFASDTRFISCKFEGRLEVADLATFGMVQWDDSCVFSPYARETFQRAAGIKKVPMTEPIILDAFDLALKRFRRQYGFITLDAELLNRGRIGQSPLRADVWNALEKHQVIQFHHVSGLGARGGVALSKDCMHDVQRFLDNHLVVGSIAKAVDEVKRKFLPAKKAAASISAGDSNSGRLRRNK